VTRSCRLRGWQAACLPLLALSWLLPASGVGLYLRLAFATMVVLLPGAALARALRAPGVAGLLAWTCASLFVALAVMFAVHGSLWLALGLHLGIGAAALPFGAGKTERRRARATGLVLALGVVFGMLLWKVAGTIDGDALFHLARVRKLDAFGALALRTVDEFRDGGLHPGYAFPLWHGLLALVAKVAAVDPALVVHHEASILAPLAFAVAYEAGVAVFRTAAAGLAALLGRATAASTPRSPCPARRRASCSFPQPSPSSSWPCASRAGACTRPSPPSRSAPRSRTRPTRSSCSCRSPASSWCVRCWPGARISRRAPPVSPQW